MNDIAIRFDHVGKLYKLGLCNGPRQTLGTRERSLRPAG